MKRIVSILLPVAELIAKPIMALTIITLPITSLPFLSNLMGGTVVAPAVIIFAGILIVIWVPLYLLRNGVLPGEIKPLLAFICVAFAASIMAFFLPIPSGKGNSVFRSELEGLITLAIGVSVYLVFTLWNRDSTYLKWTLRLINLTGLFILVWSFIQLVIILFYAGRYPTLIVRLQSLWSLRNLLELGFRTRVTGFAFEPSWLAHQLNLVFLPYWLAATVTGFSVTRKLFHISFENILLVAGAVILFFSLSRVGLAAFLFTLVFILLRINVWLLNWMQNHFQSNPLLARTGKWAVVPLSLLMVIFYGGLVIGMVFLAARFDPRMARLLALENMPANFFDFAAKVDFLERVVYWAGGLRVFSNYPLLGVGLGNSGFFFPQQMPYIAYRSSEIMFTLNEAAYLANVKSLWVRLLAETGLVGFSLFAAWQALLWGAGKFLRKNRSLLLRTIGWMGAFAILAFIPEGFSIDTFALPYLWVAMGLVTAASVLARRAENL
jgi:hypothetical protein